MKKYYGLTGTEAEIMNIFWDSGEDAFTFKELKEYVHEYLGKNWKNQTLSTFLSNLRKMGLLGVKVSGRNYIYSPLYSRQEYIGKWVRDLISTDFGNSLSRFVSAFMGNEKLSKEEVDEIRKILGR